MGLKITIKGINQNNRKGIGIMADKKINTTHGLQETKGTFELRGVVRGTDKDNFYKEIETKSGKVMKIVNFGADIEKDKTVYLSLNGFEKDKVFFSTKKDGKTITEQVAWKDRNSFKKKDYSLIGIRLGITKTIDQNGKEVNEKKNMTEFDACSFIGDNLKDDMSVYTRGKLEFSTYNDKHYTKFVPNQVSLCKPIDFDEEDYAPVSNFEQTIIYTGINKGDNEFVLSGKVIGYSSIEDVEFYITANREKLAKAFKKLRPYTAIKVYGNIVVEQEVETVDEDDEWGEPNPMDRISNPVQRKLYVTGAVKDSIDPNLYSEEDIETAIAKLKSDKQADKDYGSDDDDDWGTVGGVSSGDDDDWS